MLPIKCRNTLIGHLARPVSKSSYAVAMHDIDGARATSDLSTATAVRQPAGIWGAQNKSASVDRLVAVDRRSILRCRHACNWAAGGHPTPPAFGGWSKYTTPTPPKQITSSTSSQLCLITPVIAPHVAPIRHTVSGALFIHLVSNTQIKLLKLLRPSTGYFNSLPPLLFPTPLLVPAETRLLALYSNHVRT
jgi:hypothetical protein